MEIFILSDLDSGVDSYKRERLDIHNEIFILTHTDTAR